MGESIITIKRAHTIENVINKSRFIAHIKPVKTEEEAKAFIDEVKKEHREATHNCSAYTIGDNMLIQKANDDGEPSGTAGVPMLEVLKKRRLKDTCAVVTRYFGGIKLGAGGLIRAYGKSVSEGLNHIGVVERKLMRIMHTSADYTWLGKIENELRESQFLLKEIHYSENVEFETYVEEKETNAFSEWMTELTNGKSDIKEGELTYLEKAVNHIKETE